MTTKPNSFLAFLSTLMIFAAVGASLAGYALYAGMKGGPLSEPKLVLIERGMGTSAIAAKLEEDGVIDSSLLFKAYAKLSSKGASLKAGEYEFPPEISMVEALNLMEEGKVFDRKFTVREGLTSYQIVKIINAIEELEGEIAEIPEEGSLLPETYHYIKGDSKIAQIGHMQQSMQSVIHELWPARADNLPFDTIEEAITLASIVEKETGIAEERKRVAGVFINRLRREIPLQTDPTVIYAITKGKVKDDGKGPLGRRLLTKDLQVDDPYNTYKYPGLPPGPIANPGRASIEAVLHPEEHDYIYFVADGTGGHVFAKTLAEHNANVTKWRKIRRSQ